VAQYQGRRRGSIAVAQLIAGRGQWRTRKIADTAKFVAGRNQQVSPENLRWPKKVEEIHPAVEKVRHFGQSTAAEDASVRARARLRHVRLSRCGGQLRFNCLGTVLLRRGTHERD
jgi:hypothetical protein